MPRNLDPDGFDPVRDTVGAGVYGGKVKKDANGEVIWGEQYACHCKGPGPVYLGKGAGLTDVNQAVSDNDVHRLEQLLSEAPERASEISTGGATPLHFCGMSRRGQLSTETILKFTKKADLEAIDTCGGLRPLHRMASNDLAIGAEALLKAGADPNGRAASSRETPLSTALRSGAMAAASVIQRYGGKEELWSYEQA